MIKQIIFQNLWGRNFLMKANIFQVKEMIQYKISTNNIHIINSFQYTTRKEMKKIIQYLKELYPNNIVFKRPISSLIRE